MDLLLARYDLTPERTIGKLAVDGVFVAFTLEDAVHAGDKVPGQTAIPAGRYRVVLAPSERFRRIMPRLVDVPGFDGILIHVGNTAENTDGCILVGRRRGPSMVLESQAAFDALFAQLQGASGPIWITITNPEGAVA